MPDPELTRTWRNMVRIMMSLSACSEGAKIEDENEYYAWLGDQYNYFKTKVSELQEQHASEETIVSFLDGVYMFAVGLFLYGHLEFAEEILLLRPIVHEPEHIYVHTLRLLLPLPEDLYPRKQEGREAVRAWLHENQAKLEWNAELLRYTWKISPSPSSPLPKTGEG